MSRPAWLHEDSGGLDEYQVLARGTAFFPDIGVGVYPALGLGGEAGEVLEKIKKLHRDRGGVVEVDFQESLEKELGDVLWYVAALADAFDLSLDDIARKNLEKLALRKHAGTLKGSGDAR